MCACSGYGMASEMEGGIIGLVNAHSACTLQDRSNRPLHWAPCPHAKLLVRMPHSMRVDRYSSIACEDRRGSRALDMYCSPMPWTCICKISCFAASSDARADESAANSNTPPVEPCAEDRRVVAAVAACSHTAPNRNDDWLSLWAPTGVPAALRFACA